MADVQVNDYRVFIALKESIGELDWIGNIRGINVLAHAVATHPILHHKKAGGKDYEEWTKTVGDTCDLENWE
ncbi:hypothetical protein BW14_07070 [Bifidobacterium sp. UTBIF-68]|uniref:hypothetical protein n=1 Tax=Bifidobacterium sp. UTBIF-68 TaxID=1465262 RepID=UPI00112BF5C9|nr:hypothetical protein [Bifidobacterium sp. UTBIF-68]TPF92916.1 hypothetical protein BW14_07070 [Bifidobacterium sp. UTBIF-68]